MANTQAMCTSFKKELLLATHAFGDGTGVPAHTSGVADAFMAALFLTTGTLGAGTTSYTSVTGSEVSGTGYTPGGVAVTFGAANNPSSSGTTAFTTPTASIVFTGVTLATAFDTVLLYNNTLAGKNAVSVHTFTAQTITAGTLTLTMPTNAAGTALLQIS